MKTRILCAVLALVLTAANAHAGNVAVNHRGEVVTGKAKAKPHARPAYAVPQSLGGSDAATVPESTQVNPQNRPTCWGENCGDTGRLQSGG